MSGVAYKISVTENAAAIVRNLDTMPQWLQTRVATAMDRQNLETVGHIQKTYLSFPSAGPSVPNGLRVQSSRYRNSLRAEKSVVSGTAVKSTIGTNIVSKGGVSYPAVHEFGATIPEHTIKPVNAKALRFKIKGRVIFSKSAKIPEITLPARRPIQQGIQDRLPSYTLSFTRAILAAWRENNN